MIDEKALRKEGFSEGPRVVLGDGQEWTFPEPILRIFPQREPDGSIGSYYGNSFGPSYEDYLDTIAEAESPVVVMHAKFDMAAKLLLRNYDLNNRQLRRLLPVYVGQAPEESIWPGVTDVLLGNLPKLFPDGSDSPSSPTG